MSMKTKDPVTICPTQKMTFLPGCTPFYRKLQEFGTNRELLVAIRALGNEPVATKYRNSSP